MQIKTTKTKRWVTLKWIWLPVLSLFVSITSAQGKAIIINHTCTDITKIPLNYVEKSKTMFKVAYGHTSHGSQIVAGMNALKKNNPDLFAFGEQGLSLRDGTPKGMVV